jgi:hypothetical protein
VGSLSEGKGGWLVGDEDGSPDQAGAGAAQLEGAGPAAGQRLREPGQAA